MESSKIREGLRASLSLVCYDHVNALTHKTAIFENQQHFLASFGDNLAEVTIKFFLL